MHPWFPNLRHLRVFLETVRTGSVSLAARKCHLSQPAATQAIARLEKDLGTTLLLRRTRSLTPTENGRLFHRRAEAALAHLRSGARAASRARPGFERAVTAAQLRTLIAIANTGSFTVAAHRLNLAQPTVHRAARSLEQIAGTPFFTASPSGVELSNAAQSFAIGAKLAQAEIRQCVEEIVQKQGESQGTFVLGSLPLARTSIVPGAIHSALSGDRPLQIRVVDGRYPELLRSLREGDIDCLIGALRNPVPADDVTQEALFDDPLAIVVHPTHPLTRHPAPTVADTLAYPWLAPPKETPAGQYLWDRLRIPELDQTPVRVVASSLAVIRGMLAQGPYVTIISAHQIRPDLLDGHMSRLDIPMDQAIRTIGLTYRQGWRPTAGQENFLEMLRLHARQGR